MFVSKWDNFENFYFKVGQMLFKRDAEIIISNWGKVYLSVKHTVISKWGSYFKVG